ncbi:MAG: energy-coupling factor transporter transmembrane component T [Ruthenibacterium lactatiformans]|uniref:energy-coupling factor transporter transmembrane component T n=1 Tax=Ruthenibacterium lactatiformans TaxID=1550024 RepID=UPI0039914AA1
MFNALLGSFVAWSLTAGALPGPWPAAASLALGGALLLLHGHTHGAALTVDVLARRSRFLTVNPGLKLWCCAALLALCLLARTPGRRWRCFCSVRVNGGGRRTPARLSVAAGRACYIFAAERYCAAVGIRVCARRRGKRPVSGRVFCPARPGANGGPARYGAGAGRGGLYFLSLSTPVPELLDALRRARVPEVVGDLAVLIYRYIFILFATFRSMRDAAASRLGYAGPVRSLRTTGRVYGGLLAHSFRRAQACFDAMESRCYDGGIRFLTREKPVRAPHALVCGALTAGMVLALVCGA